MAFSKDLKKAARRHLRAAQVLYVEADSGSQPGCKSVAGYLFGLAGELAVKEIMRDSGIEPLPPSLRREDPYFAHFPELRVMLSEASGRRANELRAISDSGIFNNWDTNMRYAPTQEILGSWIDSWKSSAEELVDKMGAV